jgi:hypothetical protein
MSEKALEPRLRAFRLAVTTEVSLTRKVADVQPVRQRWDCGTKSGDALVAARHLPGPDGPNVRELVHAFDGELTTVTAEFYATERQARI